MRLRRGVTVLAPGDPVERPITYDDSEAAHQTVGRHFLIGTADVAVAVHEARAELGDIDVPAGFEPLPSMIVVEMVRALQLHRMTLSPDDETFRWAFRGDGRELGPETTIFGLDGPKLEAGCWIAIDLRPPAVPGLMAGGGFRGDSYEAVLEMCRADAREFALWFTNPDGAKGGRAAPRCWRAGSPHPAPLRPVERGESRPLPDDVKRKIRMVARDAMDHLPAEFLSRTRALRFRGRDGYYPGLGNDFPDDTPAENVVAIPIGPDTSTDEIDGLLNRWRVFSDGSVELPPA